MVASKMGVPEASAEKIEEILETQPEKAVLVREADQDFKTKIRDGNRLRVFQDRS